MADLVFMPIADQIKDASYSCYDGACGTGGMLTVAQNRLLELAKKQGKEVAIHLFGQEINPETYAICTADMLLKGDGEEAEHIMYGSTLSDDQHSSRQFDFMLSNPPYGKSWKTDAEKMGGKKDILDTRFNTYLEGGEEMAMIPDVSDGQMLFLLNNISKMKRDTTLGSRIAEVHNESSLFKKNAGSGESNARRYMFEKDLVEAIIALPDSMFYNTSLGTYIWVLSNKKEDKRAGKVQLIDASQMKEEIKKKLGDKKYELTPELRKKIIDLYLAFDEADKKYSRVFDNEDFGYYHITVNRPLRLAVVHNDEGVQNLIIEDKQFGELVTRVVQTDSLDYNEVMRELESEAKKANLKLTAKRIKLFRSNMTQVNPAAMPVMTSSGSFESDKDLSDLEKVPLKYPGGVEEYFKTEILPYSEDAWIDYETIKIGYEVSFTEEFYEPSTLRSLDDIVADILEIEKTTDGLIAAIFGGIANE
jgi:type I restriction enzyme M protein